MQFDPTGINGFQSGRVTDLSPEAVFAGRVRERRDFLGMSQAELARGLGMLGVTLDATAITRLEKGDKRVRLDEAVAICLILGLDLQEVIAPHPGDLTEQLDRADIAEANAEYAVNFWTRELEAARTRAADLRALVTQQNAGKQRMRQEIAERAQNALEAGDYDALYGEGMWTTEEGTEDGVDQEAP
jgi:transcriptional regulator with XRE-family HTH domain